MAGNAEARRYPSEAKPGGKPAELINNTQVSWPLAAWKKLPVLMLALSGKGNQPGLLGAFQDGGSTWRGQGHGSLLPLVVGDISARPIPTNDTTDHMARKRYLTCMHVC